MQPSNIPPLASTMQPSNNTSALAAAAALAVSQPSNPELAHDASPPYMNCSKHEQFAMPGGSGKKALEAGHRWSSWRTTGGRPCALREGCRLPSPGVRLCWMRSYASSSMVTLRQSRLSQSWMLAGVSHRCMHLPSVFERSAMSAGRAKSDSNGEMDRRGSERSRSKPKNGVPLYIRLNMIYLHYFYFYKSCCKQSI